MATVQPRPALAAWQSAMGYSIREAAKELGCSRAAFTGWVRGERKTPRYIALAAAALALGMGPYGDGASKQKEPKPC